MIGIPLPNGNCLQSCGAGDFKFGRSHAAEDKRSYDEPWGGETSHAWMF